MKYPTSIIPLIAALVCCLFLAECADDKDNESRTDGYRYEVPGEMVTVAGGYFSMGAPSDPTPDFLGEAPDVGYANEQPLHEVWITAFAMDRTEVTNIQYRACVVDGACLDPQSENSLTREDYYLDPVFDHAPVVNVTWAQAQKYCEWAQKRLPTEAEWEKAARGSEDTRWFPWGDADPDCTRANLMQTLPGSETGDIFFQPCAGDTMSADLFEDAASPYGVLNLSGNVAEWTADYYAADYYNSTVFPNNSQDPRGPSQGETRVVRGGSFVSIPYFARTSFRSGFLPDGNAGDIGFRCAGDLEE
jgi:formylglycine-generating enzyme required for sulfatase activity